MLAAVRGFCLALVVALAPFAFAQSAPSTGHALAAKLTATLGPSWTVRTALGSVEANRATPSRRAADFDVRAARETRWLHTHAPEVTVDTSQGGVHLAGAAAGCDAVAEAAEHFAAIPGVDTVVIDTRCDPPRL